MISIPGYGNTLKKINIIKLNKMAYAETQKDRDFNRITDLMGDYIEAKGEVNKLKAKLDWFNSFVDFIQCIDNGIYNQACIWSDKTQKNGI